MPVAWRLHVLEGKLDREFGEMCVVESVNLYDLNPAEQTAVLDALVEAQAGFPVVLVDGVVACVDDIDADAIAKQVANVAAGSE